MADSLFDNRYRYDYIYPRGRSGETLRAADTETNDRPVVIKRPAPNDAPPIRAGQEVSILTERKALKRLSGHPVLTEVLDEGQFFVGGQPHQYIVMERATGMIVADTVLTLARNDDRLPRLEMLVILDSLLDLLIAAHEKDIVYNDVDAKHLFWSRESYRLKVIDWGNAVFLEGDEITPQGISRQTDIFQVGELLYFILTGGRRVELPRDAGPEFLVDFGADAEAVPNALQTVVSKALHPNQSLRYRTLKDLRRDLADLRRILERERDTAVNHVLERLRRDLSKTELRSLTNTLESAFQLDPGYPEARQAQTEIDDRLRDLEVSADLDAVKIYMTGGNWARAADLLNELRDKAGPNTTALVELLLDCTMLMLEAELETASNGITDAVGMLFDGHMVRAAHTLLTQDTPDDRAWRYQWLMAERISSRVPEILLLRPNLYRLELALNDLVGDGVNINDARDLLAEINDLLGQIPGGDGTNLAELRDAYRAVVDKLSTLNQLLSTVMVQQRLSNRRLPLSSLDRATNAAMALADNMHVIGKQAAASPRDALVALDNSRAINPTSDLWDSLSEWLNTLYERLQSYQTYVPAADGSDLAGWFGEAKEALMPYTDRLFDEMLTTMVEGLDIAASAWRHYSEMVIVGNRQGALDALDQASNAVSTLSPTLTGWLNQLRAVVGGAAYVQRHAVFGGLGRALADGYEAFDRGRLPEAEQLGQRAQEIASDAAQRSAADRLVTLSATLRDWIDRRGVHDRIRSQTALNTVEALFTDDELRERERFASQMPSEETYLKAMGKGLIAHYEQASTPALRLYFASALLRGTTEAHTGNLTDAEFWQAAAERAIGDYGPRHPATHLLAEFISRRTAINQAADLINTITEPAALERLEAIRRELNENAESKVLQSAGQSIREFETALRDWSDGDFRAAGLKLENAIKAAREAESTADIDLSDYLGWLGDLQAVTAELHTLGRQMRQAVERRPAQPVPAIAEAHVRHAEVTHRMLGEPYHAQLQLWRETYEQFESIYTDQSLRRSAKLERFNEAFKAMFIDRHPAYGLYRHWYDLTESAPEFPAPPTDEPTPRIDEDEDPADAIYLDSRKAQETPAPPSPLPGSGLSRRWVLLGAVLLILVLAGGAFVLSQGGATDDDGGDNIVAGIELTLETPTSAATTDPANGAVIPPVAVTAETAEPTTAEPTSTPTDPVSPTSTLIERFSPTPTATTQPSETPVPSSTPTTPPTETPIPTETPVPTETLTPTITPTPTLPPQGIQGTQDLLDLLTTRIDPATYSWTPAQFAPASGNAGWRLGVGEATENDELVISLDDETLNQFYGNNAPARIRRVETNLSFTTYNPAIVDEEDVTFGVLLQSVNDPELRVGLVVQVVDLRAVNLLLRVGDETTFVIQRSVNTIDPRLRLERDPDTGDVTAFYNDIQIGEPMPFVAPEAPVIPALFVREGGVIVNVTGWRLVLR